MRKILFDSDTASDDTLALLLAIRKFEVLGVTIVAGNVRFENQVRNALFTLEYFGYDAPVFLGPRRPIMGIWKTVEEVHGANGLGGWNFPEPSKSPESEFAADALLRLSKVYSGELEILAVSPLTNIALAYLKDPAIVRRVKKLWVMGGAFYRGNTTQIAEFNFWVDPEAARIVLNAGFDVTIVPWETAEQSACISKADWEDIARRKTKASEFFVRSNAALLNYSIRSGAEGSVHPDSLTAAIAFDQSIVTEARTLAVDVETCAGGRGAMLLDSYGLTGKQPNASVVYRADSSKFRELVLSQLS